MAFKNSNWDIVWSTYVNTPKKVKWVLKMKWKKFHYVWRTKDTWSRIVLYEWILLWEADESWIVEVRYLDRNLIKNPDKTKVTRQLPIKFLTFN